MACCFVDGPKIKTTGQLYFSKIAFFGGVPTHP